MAGRAYTARRSALHRLFSVSHISSFQSMNNPSAETYIGKHLLFGITYLDHNENVVEQVQLHGTITRIDESAITIRLNGSDEEFTLPPDLNAINEAAPGEYRL